MPVTPIAAVLLDIEGTTTPVAFVHDVLFPYARAALPEFLATRAGDPEVAAALAEVDRIAPGRDRAETLLHWMDQDAKITPLKTLQGLIWRDGYARGRLRGQIYPDVAPTLRHWSTAGLKLAIYSSGSSEAQRLLFANTPEGDLSSLFSGFFDTRVGGKRDPDSYARLAIALGLPSAEILFLSDVEAELDAAAAAGMRTCQLVRPQDATRAGERHATAADLSRAWDQTRPPG